MKVLIAPDKFKGSLSATAVGNAIAKGFHRSAPAAQTKVQILADGGEGSLEIIASLVDTQTEHCTVADPLGRPVEAHYLRAGEDAYIEMAAASGLVLLTEAERNPLKTNTYGTGQLVRDALEKGAKRIFLFLGGSATNDAGMGIAAALGFRFENHLGEALHPIGERLKLIRQIHPSPDFDWAERKIYCLCDVQNPLLGPDGATRVYGPQKGADPAKVEELEVGMASLNQVLEQFAEKSIANIPGGGAAGGIAAGLHALMQAEIRSGIETILELADLEEQVREADLVISGEGKLDSQTLSGKVINGLSQLCQKYQKPLWLFVGQHDLDAAAIEQMGVKQIFAVMDKARNLEDAMQNTAAILEALAFEAMEKARA